MNLTCNGFHFYAPEKIKWYRWYSGKQHPSETPGNTLEVRDSGQYGCQAPGSLPSRPVRLLFSTGEKEGELLKTLEVVAVHLSSLDCPRTEALHSTLTLIFQVHVLSHCL